MMTNNNKVDYSNSILENENREYELNDFLLSEGSNAQNPIIIGSLDINMTKIKLNKKKSTMKDKFVENMTKNNMNLYLKDSPRKSCPLSKVHYLCTENSELLKRRNLKMENSKDISPKQSTSCQSTQTLKDEIRSLLRKLAKTRLLNSEWEEAIITKKNTEEVKQTNFSFRAKSYFLSKNITCDPFKTPKVSANFVPVNPEDISMWHIHPNQNNSFFD